MGGCALQRMTPKSLLKRFSNKLVLVFGDSISKNFAGSPAGCALQRMTPKSLLKRFSNKLVLVFGDSISKNFAGSPAGCALQRMTPKSLLKRFSNKLVLVFGDSISKNFAGSVACVLYAASPGTIQNFRIANGNTKAYGVRVPHFRTRSASVFSNWLNHASGLGGSMNRVDLDQIDPQITDLLPLADIVVFQATKWRSPDPGLKELSCETSKMLTAQQAEEFAKGNSTKMDGERRGSSGSCKPPNRQRAKCDKGCALQRMTPKRLLTRFRNKLVLVFGDSVSKNFAGSVACVLHAASPGTIQNFRIANGNTKAYGVRVPSTNTRFASVFSNWLNQASGLGGSMNRIDLDKIDPQITDLLPLADIVVFQATNWWFPAINKWYLGGKEQSLSKEAAYEIGLKTLRDYVVKSGFKGRVALVGVSPSHYKVPGLKEGSCETSKILTAQQVRN
ncbi:unnamed protein product [Closterium sp. NIES-64]|nr:unnamed protein product [Closterium sp. NIES-64]